MEKEFLEKKPMTFLVPPQAGDKFLNTDEFDFIETKDGKYTILEEKIINK